MKQKSITSFREEHRFLSNFHPCPVTFEGAVYPCVENAYQAAKTTNLQARFPFRTYTAGQSKRAGSKLKIRKDWDKAKFGVMLELVRQKFKNPELKELLLATGNAEIIEGNSWGDIIWGCVYEDGAWVGHNFLGRILMKVREEIK